MLAGESAATMTGRSPCEGPQKNLEDPACVHFQNIDRGGFCRCERETLRRAVAAQSAYASRACRQIACRRTSSPRHAVEGHGFTSDREICATRWPAPARLDDTGLGRGTARHEDLRRIQNTIDGCMASWPSRMTGRLREMKLQTRSIV